MRSMFDTIAPRYDLVNRIMTFRMDVGWRRTDRARRSACRRARRCSTWPAAPATCAASWPPPGYRPIGVDLSLRHAGRRPHRRAARPGRRPPPARARRRRSTASPAASPCATSSTSTPFFAELARVVRPGGRIALLEVAEPPNPRAALGPRRLLRQGRAPHRRRCCPTRAAYRYLPQSVAYLPAARRDARRCSPSAGFADVERRPAVAPASPSCSPAPGRRDA